MLNIKLAEIALIIGYVIIILFLSLCTSFSQRTSNNRHQQCKLLSGTVYSPIVSAVAYGHTLIHRSTASNAWVRPKPSNTALLQWVGCCC